MHKPINWPLLGWSRKRTMRQGTDQTYNALVMGPFSLGSLRQGQPLTKRRKQQQKTRIYEGNSSRQFVSVILWSMEWSVTTGHRHGTACQMGCSVHTTRAHFHRYSIIARSKVEFCLNRMLASRQATEICSRARHWSINGPSALVSSQSKAIH